MITNNIAFLLAQIKTNTLELLYTEYEIFFMSCRLVQMWSSLIAKAKEGGLDVIQTYVFWNLHEPQQGQVTPTS